MKTPTAPPHERELPALAGDGALCPPREEELLELVHAHLLPPGAEPPLSARWLHARWKPGTSTTALFELELPGGERGWVTWKRYAGPKARHAAHHYRPGPRVEEALGSLSPFAALPEEGLCLWSFPADRVLRGSARLLDPRRTTRIAEAQGLFAPHRIRRRRVQAELVRLKPERRAVFHVLLPLRRADGGTEEAELAARVLPPAHARSLARARAALAGGGLPAPALVASDLAAGILLEEWLPVDVPAPDDFSHAAEAGRLLARLHALPAPGRAAGPRVGPTDLLPLFAVDRELLARVRSFSWNAPAGPEVLVHGDFHPDNVAFDRERGGWALLDLDGLARGPALADLATWIADALAADPALDLDDAAAPLLAGYEAGGGARPAREALAAATARELVRLGAGALRRLESDARARAAARVERALALLDGGAA